MLPDRLARQALDNARFGAQLEEIPERDWPSAFDAMTATPVRVLRNRRFLVVIYREPSGETRMTVNRTQMRSDGRWVDGITWDELQRLKSDAGYGDAWMVEVYPPDAEVIDKANMRHLWLLHEEPSYGWGRS